MSVNYEATDRDIRQRLIEIEASEMIILRSKTICGKMRSEVCFGIVELFDIRRYV